MSISDNYKIFRSQLCTIYDEIEAEHITRMIFESVMNISRLDIITHPNKELSLVEKNKLQQCLEELIQQKPVQYVIGFTWFYKLRFMVNEHVLIPRPETEELIAATIKELGDDAKNKILEIGSGSGCIPIAIKKNAPNTIVTSIDISESAIAVAKMNAEHHHTDISFRYFDFLDTENWNTLGKFDFIVSNPPYIPQREYEVMDNNVRLFEPASALFVPNHQPLIFYEKIAEFSIEHLHENGKIFLEIHQDFGKQVCAIFNEQRFTTELKKDIYENDRFVIATRSH